MERKVFQSTTWTNTSSNNYSIKWPNDIFCSTTKTKIAGILLEAQSKGNEIWISCGIGINSKPRIVDGEMKGGVSETGLEGLEKHVHIHLTSWFENHQRVPDVDKNFLHRRWWNVASNSHIIGKNKKYNNQPCVVSEITTLTSTDLLKKWKNRFVRNRNRRLVTVYDATLPKPIEIGLISQEWLPTEVVFSH